MLGHKRDQNGTTVCCWLRALPVGLGVCLSVCVDFEEHHLCICSLERKKEGDHYWEFCYSPAALFSHVKQLLCKLGEKVVAWLCTGCVNVMNSQKSSNAVCLEFHLEFHVLSNKKPLIIFRKKLLI